MKDTSFKGGKIPPVFEEEHKNIFDEIALVEKRLAIEQDEIVVDFIYNNHIFDKHYRIPKERVNEVFNFYLEYAPIVDKLKKNKLPNKIIRKIKQWKFFKEQENE